MTNMAHGLSRLDTFLRDCLGGHGTNAAPLPQTFGYLFHENPVTGNLTKKAIVDGFDALVETMRVDQVENGPADAGMTFFGQFIDHDITLDATSAIGQRIDPRSVRNVRTPNLDLDCVYGDGPEASPYLYSHDPEGFMLLGRPDSPYDLARNCHGRALIGDPRNDENIIVSQIQAAFVMLHNILMTMVTEGGAAKGDVHACAQMGVRRDVWHEVIPKDMAGFEEVRRFIRLHYQWLVLKDFLPSFVEQSVIDSVLAHDPFHDLGPIMPAEFSVAAYRFGHATVQAKYDLSDSKTGVDLFTMEGFGPRDADHDLEMARFFGAGAQKALPVGVKMAKTLFELPDSVVSKPLMWGDYEIPVKQAKKLALRNILRDRTAMHLVSGQQAAAHLGLDVIPAPEALQDHHIDKTPLWFYCLQEASTFGAGKLTGVGGRIVASVLIRAMKLDPESVLNLQGFQPWSGFGDHFSMASLMQFVEAHRDDVAHREDLYCH
ncbi:peroxidase family protein [Palleronia pelagia]|uniref:Animal haem peroxidase n=1 Tax=Palleronia pelagia TaxID=387096 RepID=A0A1H8BPU8_9RHOB|nr:peroxidase family protein [Palleronia pelagia]SEM84154.1 Animal haem peroxidase [Palleronia pelagia]